MRSRSIKKAHDLFIEAFRMNTVTRSLPAEYWLGVLHALESLELAVKGRKCEFDANPFDAGTMQAADWYRGQREGQRLWRINMPKPNTTASMHGDLYERLDC